METVLANIGYSVRSLMKAKLFTLVALASLAIGIGANVTVFSVVDAIAFRPLPYADVERLVDLQEWSATKLCAGCSVGTSYATFNDWRSAATSFSAMGAYVERPFVVSGTESAERVGGGAVSANVFELLGIHAAHGRGFVAEDERDDAPAVVLLSDALWNRRYGGDARVIGQTIRVNGAPATVIGVMPPNFKFPEFAELWMPIARLEARVAPSRSARDLGVVARLKPGVTLEKANAEMAVVAAGLAARHSDLAEWSAKAEPLRSAFGAVPPEMYVVLLGAVGMVLLIVCANLAGLLLARGAVRQREIAIRLALGASRRNIVGHLLTESLLLSCVGGALGLLLALWGVDFAVASLGREAPFYVRFGIDARTIVYCAGVSIVTAILFGLVPALRASAPDVHATLKETGQPVQRSRLRGLLVISELALSIVLLAGAGELMKSFVRVSEPESGYDDRELLSGRFEFLDSKYRDHAAILAAANDVLGRVRAIPGVTNVATDRFEFIAGFGRDQQSIRAEGVQSIGPGVSPRFYHAVSPDYFATVRLAIVSGRAFTDDDRAGSAPVAIVNRHLANTLWSDGSAIGRRIKLGSADSLPWVTIVGITSDIASRGVVRNYAYVPEAQAPTRGSLPFLVRSTGDALRHVAALRSAAHSVDADLPVLELATIAQKQRDNYWPYQMYAIVMWVFAGFAVLLAAVGLYGVIAYNTAQRTREIGIRLALGAAASDVVAMIARQGARIIAIGILVGVAGSAFLLRVLGSMLFGASPVDIPVFLGVSGVLAAVAMLAVWVPARRASRVSPLVALRAE